MRDLIDFRKCAILISVIVIVIQDCSCIPQFTCPTQEGDPLPDLPAAYSTNMRINYIKQQKTVDARQVVNIDGSKMSLELWADKRHVKYIQHGYQLLTIKYNSDSNPTCTVQKLSNLDYILEEEDAGPSQILETLSVAFHEYKPQFVIADVNTENGVLVKKWEVCLRALKVNVSLSFTELNWKQGHTSVLHKGKYPVSAEAQIKDDFMVVLFNNFDPVMPPDTEFQPPENVYCEGFRTDKRPPNITNYFSYNSELIAFESSQGIAPVATHRTVYYDFPAGISRTDFYDALAEDQDLFSTVTAQSVSIIHDFNSEVQYQIDPMSGKCVVDSFKTTIGPVNIKETGKSKMPDGLEFFSLNAGKISYNGQFFTRGYMADVYTALIDVSDGKSTKKYIYSWYFSSARTQIVEKEDVEKNVLLRMVVSPVAADGKEGEVDVNFYNFEEEEPSTFMYDLTSCYNDSYSKSYVLTFPANDLLKGSEKSLKNFIHHNLMTVTGVSKQRIFVSEVNFIGKYMFAEFKLLARPDALGYSKVTESLSKENTLEAAIAKLKESVSNKQFKVSVPAKGSLLVLEPEPDGLNEFAGDRKLNQSGSNYKEGSVIALTIGMLFLGFILGGVTLNLIVSRKYGVSLFQKKTTTSDPFTNSLGESSM